MKRSVTYGHFRFAKPINYHWWSPYSKEIFLGRGLSSDANGKQITPARQPTHSLRFAILLVPATQPIQLDASSILLPVGLPRNPGLHLVGRIDPIFEPSSNSKSGQYDPSGHSIGTSFPEPPSGRISGQYEPGGQES